MPTDNPAPTDRRAVVIVGSYVHDHVWQTERFPDTGETLSATGFSTGPGGKGFNQAVACHRQGVAVTFIGAIGSDHLGRAARMFAETEGLECLWLQHDDVPTAAASIAVDRRGANRILVNLAANERLDIDFIEQHAEAFENARVVLVQLENNLDAVRAALDLGARHGSLRMLNPAPVHRDIDAALLACCDLIT
ncbi:MAG: PfkB family carbohydrate kinase, partial [Dokdonella sp.]